MRRFRVAYYCAAHFSALDQARFFLRFDRLVPRPRAYARWLLSSIDARPALGLLPSLRRVGFKTFFKGGWRGRHRSARARGGAVRAPGHLASMAVLTDGNPSHAYGAATLRGVAERIFRAGDRSGSGTFGGGARPRPGRHRPRTGVPASSTSAASRRGCARHRLRRAEQPHRSQAGRLL